MRHKYSTRGIVLGRAPFGEAHARLSIVTDDLGVVHAYAAGLRRQESKLAHALATFCESDVVLVAGAEGWRLAGAVLAENWFARLASSE
ncbi:MAG: recombination protein O N-terminal domain-containing protein, partial [Patescibacteria group bacterium]|nr:recombination protein O N-terminal domain-containing protein [Patescibacteria group bacterium]